MTMKTILVVDDEKSVRDSLKMVLEFESYEVLFAESGPEALRQVAAVPVDLVLLDVKMAGMDGLEVLQRIREKNSDLPVIMIGPWDHRNCRRGHEARSVRFFAEAVGPRQVARHCP